MRVRESLWVDGCKYMMDGGMHSVYSTGCKSEDVWWPGGAYDMYVSGARG